MSDDSEKGTVDKSHVIDFIVSVTVFICADGLEIQQQIKQLQVSSRRICRYNNNMF